MKRGKVFTRPEREANKKVIIINAVSMECLLIQMRGFLDVNLNAFFIGKNDKLLHKHIQGFFQDCRTRIFFSKRLQISIHTGNCRSFNVQLSRPHYSVNIRRVLFMYPELSVLFLVAI